MKVNVQTKTLDKYIFEYKPIPIHNHFVTIVEPINKILRLFIIEVVAIADYITHIAQYKRL